jgi:hypothetical protein
MEIEFALTKDDLRTLAQYRVDHSPEKPGHIKVVTFGAFDSAS